MPTPAAMFRTALPLAAALLLAGCGHGGSAGEGASAANVEMPAEEAMRGLDANATPMPDTEATAQAVEPTEPAAAPAAPKPAAPKSAASASPAADSSPIRM